MKKCKPYSVKIYCGLKIGYNGRQLTPCQVELKCRSYCNKVKLGVSVTPTQYIYVDGYEDGVIVGLINYPRFPKEPSEIKKLALGLAKLLKKELYQERITIETPDEMIMLGKP